MITQHKRYKIIISDFDGTLLRRDCTVGERTKNAIKAYIDSGGVFTVCTGRMLKSILPEVKKLGINEGLIASYQGAVISDIATGNILRHEYYSAEEAELVLSELEKKNLAVHMYTLDGLFVNYSDERLRAYEEVCHVKAEFCPDLKRKLIENKLRVIKFLAVVAPEEHDGLISSLQNILGEKYYVTASAKFLAEVLPVGQNKGEAVKFLASYYNVDINDVIAVGDNLNDLPMIEAAGLGIAVLNAAEELKMQADLVAASNDDDAVGKIIEKYGLGDEQWTNTI